MLQVVDQLSTHYDKSLVATMLWPDANETTIISFHAVAPNSHPTRR